MIPVSTLYDEYIERRKFTEQKKNPVEYIVPPPSRGSEQQELEQIIAQCFLNLTITFKNMKSRGQNLVFNNNWSAEFCF